MNIPFKAKVVIAALIAAIIGVTYPLTSHHRSPLREGLPALVSEFGTDARVLRLEENRRAGTSLDYEVIGSDNRLHRGIRRLDPYNGGTGVLGIGERRPTAAEWQQAQVQLGDIPADVVDVLFSEVTHAGGTDPSAARFTGQEWTIVTDQGEWRAHYDGSDLRPADPAAATAAGTAIGATPTATSSAPTGRRAVTSAPEKTLSGNSRKLIACIRAAHGNVTRLRACRRRFPPS